MDLNKAIKVLLVCLLSAAVIFIVFLIIYIPLFAMPVREGGKFISSQNDEIIHEYNKMFFTINEAKKDEKNGKIVQARSSCESALNILKELEVQNQKLESEVRSSISNLK